MKREDLPSLLLLPAPPQPATRVSLDAAYRPSLTAALTRCKSAERATTLIVALACPILNGPSLNNKSLSWTEAQGLTSGIYSIVSLRCAQLSIGTDINGGPNSVDVRLVLVDHDRNKRIFPDFTPAIEPNNTTIVDLPTFACAYYPWNYIYHVNTEAGYQVLNTYLKWLEGVYPIVQNQLVVVEGGLTLYHAEEASLTQSSPTDLKSVVCLGGTFDHLHPGHKLLLAAACLLMKVPKEGTSNHATFVIGITGDELLKNKKYAEYVQSWDERALSVIDFLTSILELSKSGWKDERKPKVVQNDGDIQAFFRQGTIKVQCVQIQDAFGPTITVQDIHALVVSGETRSGGKAVNDKRAEQGWPLLEIFEVDVLDTEEIADSATKTENFAMKISSTAIRQQKAEAKQKMDLPVRST